MRLLFLTCWFLEYFLMAFKEQNWSYGLIGEILDVPWVVWVMKRMRNAMDEKVPTFRELCAHLTPR
jgi:replication fork protection complex subunit Tof1/Swi1